MNYRCIVQYDGTRYEGWQKQKRTEETIQGKLEKTLRKITGEEVQVIGAGRTDAGVHSLGQVVNFHLKGRWKAEELETALNGDLPDDIALKHMETAEERFHSRFGALEKTYRYRIRTSTEKNVFERRFVWQYGKPLDVEAMKKAAAFLIGTYDFTSFCGNKKMKKSAVRCISKIEMKEIKGELQIDFTGDGFLQGMVRILVGTLVEVGEGKRKAESIPAVLESRNREKAGFTAPPQGLILVSVRYEI